MAGWQARMLGMEAAMISTDSLEEAKWLPAYEHAKQCGTRDAWKVHSNEKAEVRTDGTPIYLAITRNHPGLKMILCMGKDRIKNLTTTLNKVRRLLPIMSIYLALHSI